MGLIGTGLIETRAARGEAPWIARLMASAAANPPVSPVSVRMSGLCHSGPVLCVCRAVVCRAGPLRADDQLSP